MVKDGEDFLVYDAKSGDDMTRQVLAQIIFEQENKAGQNLLPTTFLRQLIRFYGDSMRAMVPSFLEHSMHHLAREQDGLREKMSQTFGPTAFQHAMEEQVRANMSFFNEAMRMFTPFGPGGQPGSPDAPAEAPVPAAPAPKAELDDIKRQMAEMQSRLEALAKK